MPLFGEFFLSEILKKPVFDPKGDVAGRVKDIIAVRGEPLPKVAAIIVEKKGRLFSIAWKDINLLNKRIISTYLSAGTLDPYETNETDLLAVRDIFDKQIVDANGAKVVRVNDIKLEGYEGEAVLAAVDMGVRGLLRRLGVERGSEDLLKVFQVGLPHNLVSWKYIQPLKPKLKTLTLTVPRKLIELLHPADIADIISQVPREEGANFLKDLDVETAADALSELKPEVQADMIASMEAEKAAHIIEEMSPDKAADVLGDLPQEKTTRILEHIEKEDAQDIQELLGHEEDTAGGMMTTEYIAYPAHITAGEALERLRKDIPEVETLHYIFVVDQEERLVGKTPLKDLFFAPPGTLLADVMEPKPKAVAPEMDDMEVAELISKYNLLAVPVVDGGGVMQGVVNIEAIIDKVLPPAAKRKRKNV